ncbi:GNAT family N-acetyltransferase [Reinekea blandensis]|uniref:Putative acetyltransferase n=1 Tax=Reinekea blandensis MED297 TaxID=314283 RepID=A4BG57_9GAMM|nr:GNAT family N-acetyltransferase [Reinekea blandensis]EAR08852.1 putative acetyltransferase [Reinekea sp. MED297] [Reinekea blandensis MED297]
MIRPAQLSDLPYLYDICLRTGLNGDDATNALKDPFMVGHYFAAPYLFFQPECCFVVDIEGRPSGYIIGTTDSQAYYQWLNEQWLPQLRRKYPRASGISSLESFLYEIIHEDALTPSFCRDYPAHLHIDLLPVCQGRGLGQQLIDTFLGEMRKNQVPGVHLGVSLDNTRACRFYQKMGLHEIERESSACFMGIQLHNTSTAN